MMKLVEVLLDTLALIYQSNVETSADAIAEIILGQGSTCDSSNIRLSPIPV